MMAGRGTHLAAAGGPARHIPVMLSEVLAALEPKDGEIIVDGTGANPSMPAPGCAPGAPSPASRRRPT